jgi:bifunctional NMN adenylyltransferase/nudix hydrolase
METEVKKSTIGVLVMRAQVHNLTDGHKGIIGQVLKHHKKTLIFLGVSPAKLTQNNPLDFFTRKAMFDETYPADEFKNLQVIAIKDTGNDETWSKNLDERIDDIGDTGSVTLYGSRDGFTPHYFGNFPVIELKETKSISGSEVRKMVGDEVKSDPNFRLGIIYATRNRYPITYPTVDAAIWREEHGVMQLLMARKKNDEKNKWRFVGGFIDANRDASADDAVKREVREEVPNITVGEPEYIGTTAIDDWRYRNEVDSIMTTFFLMQYQWGSIEAADDIEETKWFDADEILDHQEGYVVVNEHDVLTKLLKAYLNKAQKKGETK